MDIITSKDNSIAKLVVKLNKTSKSRKDNGVFITEGYRLVSDAVNSSCEFEFFVFSETAFDKFRDFYNKVKKICKKVFIFSDKLFSHISDTETPQGVLGAVKLLDKNSAFDKIKDSGKFLILENLQDPGNLGTIFRTAEALGIDGIVLTSSCCDIYSPKVVRSTMGAIFRIPFIKINSVKSFLLDNPQINSCAAVVASDSEKIGDIVFNSPCACVIGNEGNGLTDEAISACDCSITIPMNGRAESLNAAVAASIIMWEMMK